MASLSSISESTSDSWCLAEAAAQVAQELAAAVGAVDLAVAEQIHDRQQLFAQNFERFFVVLAPVVAVGKLEAVQVPFGGREIAL